METGQCGITDDISLSTKFIVLDIIVFATSVAAFMIESILSINDKSMII